MTRKTAFVGMVLFVSMILGAAAHAADVALNAVLYPDGQKTDVKFITTDRAPKAMLSATVKPEQGQSWVDVKWSKLEPALLFGGDVNCWVLWTVTPDGTAFSQGELPVREDRGGTARFSVPFKQFAMMVTAEPFPIVRRPSTLVAFLSEPTKSKIAKNSFAAKQRVQETSRRKPEQVWAKTESHPQNSAPDWAHRRQVDGRRRRSIQLTCDLLCLQRGRQEPHVG